MPRMCLFEASCLKVFWSKNFKSCTNRSIHLIRQLLKPTRVVLWDFSRRKKNMPYGKTALSDEFTLNNLFDFSLILVALV